MSTGANEVISNELEPLSVEPLSVVDVMGPRIPTLEVVAIATAVFALVLAYLLWVDVGAEVIWLVVLVLAAGRGRWMESGLDLELPGRLTR